MLKSEMLQVNSIILRSRSKLKMERIRRHIGEMAARGRLSGAGQCRLVQASRDVSEQNIVMSLE
jgi:hypothetical protein